MKKKIAAAAAAGAVAVAAIGGGAWMAFGDENEVTERGACAGTAYELSVEDDDGGLELSYELQSTGPGEVWAVVVTQGNRTVLDGERTTDEDGELDIDVPVEKDGATDFEVTATSPDGDECVATATR